MKLKFLGTAAAEGVPGLFCSCEVCKKAWAKGGRNHRTRSQTLIDEGLLIDFGPDSMVHSQKYGLDLTAIQTLLVTHVHEDHWFPTDLTYLRPGFSAVPEGYMLTICGSEDLEPDIRKLEEAGVTHLRYQKMTPFVPFVVGNYTVTALKAWHGTEHPLVYVISDGKKTVLYDHDSDVFCEESYAYLKTAGLHFDLVSMDCTGGAAEDLPYRGHMCLGRNKIARQMLLDIGAADENTVFVLNHFSHNGKDVGYDEFAEIGARDGFLVTYDGMEVEV